MIYFLLILFVVSDSGSTSSSRLRSPTRHKMHCTCDVVDGVNCTFAEKKIGRYSCEEFKRGIPKLSLTCHQYLLNDSIRLQSLMKMFPDLLDLTIDGCSIDFSPFDVMRENSSFKTQLYLVQNSLQSSQGGRCELRIKPQLDLRRNSTNIPSPCKLTRFKVSNAFLRMIPIGFLETCKSLKVLELPNNDLTIIDDLDFVSLISQPRLEILCLSNNSISTITTSFVDKLLLQIRNFFTYELGPWVKRNKKTLGPHRSSQLLHLATQFSVWANNSHYPFSFRHLALIRPPLDFVLDKTVIQKLDLSGNRFKSFPTAIFGMYRLRVLHLCNNELSRIFSTAYNYALYSIGPQVTHLHMKSNKIIKIERNSFVHLHNILHLDLSDNKISLIPADAIPHGMKLEKLVLDHNNIHEIRLRSKMSHLAHLSVAFNRIKIIGKPLTDVIPKIECLNFSHNPLELVEQHTIFNLKRLYILDLSHGKRNQQSFMKMQAKSYLISHFVTDANRPTVDISYNSNVLLCDCHSVFAALMNQKHTDHGYDYPWIHWSKDQKCTMGQPMPAVNLERQSRASFDCYVSGKFCSQECECCFGEKSCSCRFLCPKGCVCEFGYNSTKIHVNCSNRHFTYIPKGNVNATVLQLKGNSIKSLQPNAFSTDWKSLWSLYLNNNSLTELGIGAFAHLTSLRFLDLSDNRIERISSQAFSDLENIRIIRLENNSLHSFKKEMFSSLSNLTQLFLRNNPLICDCRHLPALLKFAMAGGTSGALYIEMPNFCTVFGDIRKYGGVKTERLEVIKIHKVCHTVAKNKRKERMLQHQQRMYGLVLGLPACALLLMALIVFRYRYSVRVYMDKRVKSTLARTILSLTAYNTRAGIDVGFLVHERQTEHFYAIRRQLTGTPRQALNIIRIADHMPGSTRLGQVAHLAGDMAVCVVLISRDLLQDSLFMEALRILLVHNLERSGDITPMAIVPILLSNDVKETDEWPHLDMMLRHYPVLIWNQPFFWERLLTSLPPPPPPPHTSSVEEGAGLDDNSPLVSREEIDDMVHMCLIAHENQTSHHVRDMFDRYRSSLNLCHVRHNRLYGSLGKTPTAQALSLNHVLGNSLQVAVLVSLELLHDQWTREHLFPCLAARLQALPFRGTIILLEVGSNFAYLCQDGNFHFYDEIRRNSLVVTLAWSDVERNWDVLNAHLLPEAIPREGLDANVTGMDETEYTRCLMTSSANLHGPSASGCNIFEQHRARWPSYEEYE